VPSGIVPFSGFDLPWAVVALLGGFTILGAAELGSFVGALVTGTIEGGLAASLVTALFTSSLVGRWIGVRADGHPIVAAVVAAVAARIVGAGLDWIILSDDFRGQLGMTGPAFLVLLAFGVVVWAVPAVIGAVLGRRAREGAYVAYLLTRVNASTRSTVLELVYEESKRAGT
jgi:hypothetical protein